MTPAERLSKKVRNRNLSRPYPARNRAWKCRLRELRLSLKLSQRDIRCAVGISAACYSTIENGTDPMLSTARKLAPARFVKRAVMGATRGN